LLTAVFAAYELQMWWRVNWALKLGGTTPRLWGLMFLLGPCFSSERDDSQSREPAVSPQLVAHVRRARVRRGAVKPLWHLRTTDIVARKGLLDLRLLLLRQDL